MKKRILAFALTLAMVVGSLSMLSFVTFAEEPAATEIVSAADPIAIGDVATVAADFNYVDKNVSFVITGENLETLTLKVGGYVTTVTYAPSVAVDAASAKAGVKVALAENVTTVTIPTNLVSVYTNNAGNAVADVEIYVAEEEFKGTFVMKPVTKLSDYNGVKPTVSVTSPALAGAVTGGSGGLYSINIPADTTVAEARATAYNLGSHHSTATQNRVMSFTMAPRSMTANEFNSIEEITVNASLDITRGGNYVRYADDVQFAWASGGVAGKNQMLTFDIINTMINEKEELVLLYHNYLGGKDYRIPLGYAPGEEVSLDFEVVWNHNTSGYIAVNGKKVIELDFIYSLANVSFSSNNTNSGIYNSFFTIGTTQETAFVVDITNYVLKYTYNNLASNEEILAMFDKAVDKDGTIELSYVQETVPFVSTTKTMYSNSTAAMQGGRLENVDGISIFTVTDNKELTTHRALAQAGFAPLGEYGNRVITYKVNVANLAAYDFSNGGTLTGDAKYKDNINSKYAYLVDPGIGNDVSKSAFEKIYIGSIGKVNAYYDYYAASVFALVNDTTDGLVIVHTSSDGTETVIPVGKKLAQDITIKLTWNANDTGSIKVDTDEAVAIADCKTVFSDLTRREINTQCYYASYPTCYNGYVGLNLIRSTATYNESTAYSSATMTVEATVSNPLDVRFVATVDTLNAKEVGFEINLKGNDNVVKKSTDTVYSSINANVDGELNTITADDGKYFVALTVKGVPATGTVTLVVKPYLTYGDNTTYGTAYEVTYTDGAFVSCVPAN